MLSYFLTDHARMAMATFRLRWSEAKRIAQTAKTCPRTPRTLGMFLRRGTLVDHHFSELQDRRGPRNQFKPLGLAEGVLAPTFLLERLKAVIPSWPFLQDH